MVNFKYCNPILQALDLAAPLGGDILADEGVEISASLGLYLRRSGNLFWVIGAGRKNLGLSQRIHRGKIRRSRFVPRVYLDSSFSSQA